MKKKITRFLIVSIVMISALCVFIFAFLAVYMNRQSEKTINEVGTIYMSNINERISKHFETALDSYLSKADALVAETPADQNADVQEIKNELANNGKMRGFEYLALYSNDGEPEIIYGEPVQAVNPESLLRSVDTDAKKVAVGTDVEGNKIILLGVSAAYPMENGMSTALVAGLPDNDIKDMLVLDEEDSLVNSYIIRRDGSFVIRDDEYGENYFDKIKESPESMVDRDAEQYVSELQRAINSNENYSHAFSLGNSRLQVYCTHLPYSEWYLITEMPFGKLNEAVNGLSNQWILFVLGGCGIVLLALIFMFVKYYQLSHKQINALNKARQEAVRANKAKSEFLSSMSHDIRTPMNAIVGMTAIAASKIDDREQIKNCLKKISISSKHLLGLINDVLDMSKIESGKMTLNMDQVSLRELMDNIVGIIQPQIRAKEQKFSVLIQDIFIENVCCDSVRLNQVLLNLLSNAVKFTPNGGLIEVSLCEEPSVKGDDYVRVHILVKDSGIGMSQEFLGRIFDSFARENNAHVRRTEGVGLGMAITKYIVDAMGGFIEVKSEVGKGSEFHVALDLEKADVQEIDMVLPEWNVLVVDDDAYLCKAAVSSLKDIGMKADWTLDGESAIKLVDKRHKVGDDYRIILLDWKLPGMNGVETARRIREKLDETIPILLISAYDWGEIEEEARKAGICGFISKPLFKSTLFYGLKPFTDVVGEDVENFAGEECGLQGKRILVAEDNELNWEIAEGLLREFGVELEWAKNGRICVEKFLQSPVGYFDAILMDIRMPVMSGYEATASIRAMDRADSDVPIIAMTADAFSDDIKKCLQSGMNAHIAKPIEIREMLRLLKDTFKR
ncbi:hypothetical protein CE91St36_19440 [Christensenellaceae bacterium]|nr:hypothetical protein CE91St36_19440 [Christensenellaceae bacterium]BDF61793.1 hypothetical protein CE91St37_19430 [Christensenellaceae bacterium]